MSHPTDAVSHAEAAKMLPMRRRGKRPHISCIYRWTVSGCRGVILESLQVGGTRFKSREALARFFAKLTSDTSVRPSPNTPNQRRRAIDAAERALDDM